MNVALVAKLYVAGSGTCGGSSVGDTGYSSVVAPPNGTPTYSQDPIELDAVGTCDFPLNSVDNTGTMLTFSATNVVAD